MADYFTNFSLIMSLPNEDAQRYALDLANNASQVRNGDEPTSLLADALKEVVEDWSFETDPETVEGKPAIWLHSDSGGIDAVCAFIQHLLQKFDSQSGVSFEWSHDCSKPRTDAFGGGAAIVTAKEIKTMSSSQWIQEQIGLLTTPEPYTALEQLKKQEHVFSPDTNQCIRCNKHADDDAVENTSCQP